jgi:Mg-chelatase subunit ChlD
MPSLIAGTAAANNEMSRVIRDRLMACAPTRPEGPRQEGATRAGRPSARERERGIAVWAVLVILAFLCIAALVADFGVLLLARTEISKAVDAGALAGAQELPDEDAATEFAEDYVSRNLKPARQADVVPTVSFPRPDVIRVRSTASSPAFFARVLGMTAFDVAAAAEATRYDPDVAIIIDRSGSMCEDSHPFAGANCPSRGPWEPFSTIQETAKGFVDQLPGNPTFTLISYATTARTDVTATTNRAFIKTAIDNLRPSGFTDIAGSVTTAIEELLSIPGDKPQVIILLTDGRTNVVNGTFVGDNDPRAQSRLLAAAAAAFDEGIIIHGINYGRNTDNDLMQSVAEATEGRFYYAPDDESLNNVYTEIARKAYIRLTYVN